MVGRVLLLADCENLYQQVLISWRQSSWNFIGDEPRKVAVGVPSSTVVVGWVMMAFSELSHAARNRVVAISKVFKF